MCVCIYIYIYIYIYISIVYSQTLWLHLICSFETDFVKRKNKVKSWLSHSTIFTYHPLLKSLSKIISKNLYLLYMDEGVKRVFTPGPICNCTKTNT